MSERVHTPMTNEHFAAFCRSMVGQPYWYGTCLYKCTESLRNRKAAQYPSHYASGRTARYRQDISEKKVCADCIGAVKGYAWTGGGQGVLESVGTDKTYASSYGSHGCPDKGADSMFTYAKSKGADWGGIDTLPEVVGLALHKEGHVGYYVGNGEAVEWKSFADGCVKTKVAGRGWTSWYRLPFLDYGDGVLQGSTDDETPAETPLGSRLLMDGSEGSDVRALQEMLLSLGYELPRYGADGDFGAETEAALRAFQADAGLEADGKYGEKSHAALMDAAADGGKDSRPVQPEPPDAEKPPVSGTVVIVSDGGKVNIREGNGLTYGRITQLAPGTTLDYVATASNGWHAVVVNARVGWVSGEYSKVI